MSRGGPIYYVKMKAPGGGATPLDVSDEVLSFTYEDTEGEADKLSITVENNDLRNFNSFRWKKGGELEVSWGYEGDMAPPRACIIQAVKGFQVLTITALSKSILMHKQQRSRTFAGLTRAQVVAQIAKENGYGAEVLHLEDTKVVHETISQVRETDASFLKRLAMREGYQFFVDFDGLHFHKRKVGQKALREFTWFTDRTRGDILDIQIENDVTMPPAKVTVKARDPKTKEETEHTGSDAETDRKGTGPEIEEAVSGATGTTAVHVVMPTTEKTAEGAKRVADAKFTNAALASVKMTLKAIGDPNMLAKSIVLLSGILSLSGKYYVTSVKHNVASPYTMELKLRRDAAAAGAGKKSAAKQTPAEKADKDALAPVVEEGVSGATGTTTYRDTRGRAGKDEH